MAVSVRNSEGVRLLIEEVAKAVGVSPKELLEYYEWKANLEKLKKTRMKVTKEKAKKIIEEWGNEEPAMNEEGAVRLYYKAREEIKKWQRIEKKLKELGLE
ncbi:hypothetical protein [Thermococcus thioreducens]|uniref:Uncharacterized protein n=1 Tax=Thermococcus thioreducens TaxID=277988 RepID=A0A0Q2UNJ6_9EURY|nr:hypothetical protein [Thermococcus thioreducens]ASJ12778.1 hypothetical protein A3L14_07710 [Thermococcus thioreducens]KQH82248.1 hypothetical protein AMR53_06465 [Thermococcus thioreducens]SEV85400.1 hypothetical protein SAMN05216170_0407 [Thermococcus thioreducens]